MYGSLSQCEITISSSSKANNLPDDLREQVLSILDLKGGQTLNSLAIATEESVDDLRPILAELEREEIVWGEQNEGSGNIVYRVLDRELTKQNDVEVTSPKKVSKKSFFSKLGKIIWAIVIVVVIIPLIGQLFVSNALGPNVDPNAPASGGGAGKIETVETGAKTSSSQIDWEVYEQTIQNKLRKARDLAEAYASSELHDWGDDLVDAVDNNFLDWYFGYFKQKEIEYKAFFTGISTNVQKLLGSSSPSPQQAIAEEITTNFEVEFAKRVLRPSISQMRLDRIADKTARKYIEALNQEFKDIPLEAGISSQEWEKYLEDISVQIPDVEGNIISFPLGRVTTVGAYIAFKPAIAAFLPKLGAKITSKLAAKAGAKVAAKTTGVLAGKIGGTLLDASLGAGIILWDIWDTNHSANIEKPIVRKNLVDYIRLLEESTLDDPDTGIMTVVDNMDRSLLQSLRIIKSLNSVN